MPEQNSVPDRIDHVFAPGEFEWIEKAGIENLKGRRETADILAKEAATTLTVLLAGIGGSLAYGIEVLDGDTSSKVVAAAAVCVWLTAVAIGLVLSCLRIGSIPALYNQPGKLLQRDDHKETFDSWRYGELKNIQERIEKAVQRNNTTAKRLNLIRLLAVFTPLIALLVPLFQC